MTANQDELSSDASSHADTTLLLPADSPVYLLIATPLLTPGPDDTLT